MVQKNEEGSFSEVSKRQEAFSSLPSSNSEVEKGQECKNCKEDEIDVKEEKIKQNQRDFGDEREGDIKNAVQGGFSIEEDKEKDLSCAQLRVTNMNEGECLREKDKTGEEDDGEKEVAGEEIGEEEMKEEEISQKGKEERVPATFSFSRSEYDLALKYFDNSVSVCYRYLSKPEMAKAFVLIKVGDDKECLEKLEAFKNQVINDKFSSDKCPLLKEIQRQWGSEIVIECHKGPFTLTTLKNIHSQIKTKFPDFFVNKRTSSISTASNFSEDANSKENADSERSNATSKKASRLENPTKQGQSASDDKFQGRLSRLIVNISKADITKLTCDVIVSAANGELKHVTGVAKAIAKDAGRKLINECEKYISQKTRVVVSHHFVSCGGNLPVKQVYHAVGPKWKYYNARPDECKRLLRLTILRCLLRAEQQGHRSIAFPSISAATFKVPWAFCVESYMKAVQHFEIIRSQSETENLRHVNFVDIDDDMISAIKEHFKNNWDRPIDTKGFEFIDDRKELFTKSKSDVKSTSAGKAQSSAQGGYGGQSPSASSRVDSRLRLPGSVVHLREDCTLCAYERDTFLQLACCKKIMCLKCSEKCAPKCPFCGRIHGILTGDMPPGTMSVSMVRNRRLPGYDDGYYAIVYEIHANSSKTVTREAYIPYTKEGCKMLLLLILAFYRRLTFTYGISRTKGLPDQVTWNDIHHKTSLKPRDQFGYPDEDYIQRLYGELTSKGVTYESMNNDEKCLMRSWKKDLSMSLPVHISSF